MDRFIAFLDSKIEEGNIRISALEKESRKDDANFAKISTNIYQICKTVSLALVKRPEAGIDAVRAQFERFRKEWSMSLEKAKQHDDVDGIAVEETKLAALEDVITYFEEVMKE